MLTRLAIVAAIGVLALDVPAQTAPATASPSALAGPPDSGVTEGEKSEWSFSLAAYTYFVPDHRDYVQPTVTADHEWLHVEARYNYEDLDTGSAWIGYNFGGGGGGGGRKLTWELTPKVGGVFGHTTGAGAGYGGSLSWWKLELYSEGEYVYDARSPSDSFLYSWSEFTIAPVERLRLGIAAQRTRTDHAEVHVQPGLVLGVVFKNVAFSTYVFGLDESKPTVILALSLHF
jgi:hypothetical protein